MSNGIVRPIEDSFFIIKPFKEVSILKTTFGKHINIFQRFALGLALAVCISGFCSQAIAADEPAQATDTAQAGEPAKKEKGMLSLTKVAPEKTPVSDYSGDFLNRTTLTGDWWGCRTNLYEHGVMFDAALTQVFQGVTSGGKDTDDTVYTGLLDAGLNIDTGKLNWWPGGLFTFNLQSGFASNFPLESGNVSPTNYTELYPTGDKPQTVLMEYYWTQVLSKEFAVVLGRVNAVNFFDKNRFAQDPRNQFMNLSMDNNALFGAFISFSTYGVLASWQITDNFSINPAIFDPNTQPGNYFKDLFKDIGLATEADLDWKLGSDLGGILKVIGIYVSKDTTALDNPRLLREKIEGLSLETLSGNWIIALNAEQYLWKPSSSSKKSNVQAASFEFQERGVGLFGRFGYTPEDRNAWNIYASGGVSGRGIIPGRPYDRMGIGAYWLKQSSDLDNQPGDLLEDELGMEAFYNIALTPWAQLSFDFQWINSGVTGVSNPVVLGARLFTQF